LTRVLSALVLLPVVVGTIWFLPPIGTFVLALVAALLAFSEYRTIARGLGVTVYGGIGGTAVVLACYTIWNGDRTAQTMWSSFANGGLSITDTLAFHTNDLALVLMSGLIVVGAASVARGRPVPGILADAAVTLFAPIYIGVPLGTLAWVRTDQLLDDRSWQGRVALLLLLLIIVVSDSAQYYTGRAFGRRPLSPEISPKKTVEGAIGGVVFGTLATIVGGRYVFGSPLLVLALLGVAISLLGIVGDLFESLLKRSAGVKDSSNLIPGHGGVLDRIDSWLFAAPVYYVFVRFIA